ncbi:hypothetical protein DYB37_009422 [Aphanomyces astaci]|uniref:Uncharacterized protein n=1 Tax=Aphanomyces astaci TaxID=112090 RepID=A0A3R6XG26_APHAT|nr:hypothetical protein DYB35_012353 [Aphanomyces astaci]RHZ15716.1 hypothetical protein DYB37_009422 [Aphanomyces astaci]
MDVCLISVLMYAILTSPTGSFADEIQLSPANHLAEVEKVSLEERSANQYVVLGLTIIGEGISVSMGYRLPLTEGHNFGSNHTDAPAVMFS